MRVLSIYSYLSWPCPAYLPLNNLFQISAPSYMTASVHDTDRRCWGVLPVPLPPPMLLDGIQKSVFQSLQQCLNNVGHVPRPLSSAPSIISNVPDAPAGRPGALIGLVQCTATGSGT